jgi:hypothetical protein
MLQLGLGGAMSGRVGPQGQFHREPAAFANLASHSHAAAVGFDDVLHDAQPDPDTLGFAPQLGATPIETLEDPPLFLVRDAFAAVFNPQHDV